MNFFNKPVLIINRFDLGEKHVDFDENRPDLIEFVRERLNVMDVSRKIAEFAFITFYKKDDGSLISIRNRLGGTGKEFSTGIYKVDLHPNAPLSDIHEVVNQVIYEDKHKANLVNYLEKAIEENKENIEKEEDVNNKIALSGQNTALNRVLNYARKH
jgi:hypothetical protein